MFENAFESSATKRSIDPTADGANYPEPTTKGLKVAVVGSKHYGMVEVRPRKWVYDIDSPEYQTILRTISAFHAKYNVKLLVSGAATGADSIGEAWAEAEGIKTHIHPAKWDEGPQTRSGAFGPYNPKAGINRNEFIVRDADVVLAFTTSWKKSKGTANTISRSWKDKPTWVFDTAQPNQHFFNDAASDFVKQNSK